MAKRITIMMHDDIDRKLRIIQSRIIKEENNTCSYSRVVNDTLRRALR